MKNLYTMGYTQKTAETFFNLINYKGIKRLVDIRLHPNTQLAGFTKQSNLQYFLKRLCGCDYIHVPAMAPSKGLFDDYKKNGLEWCDYECRFNDLIGQRKIERLINENEIDDACLLCCEPEATNCHRRLVAEHFQNTFNDILICHL